MPLTFGEQCKNAWKNIYPIDEKKMEEIKK